VGVAVGVVDVRTWDEQLHCAGSLHVPMCICVYVCMYEKYVYVQVCVCQRICMYNTRMCDYVRVCVMVVNSD